MNQDLYEVLGVPRDADQAAIKSAYRKLALKYHPDRNQGDGQAEEKFKEITRAYEILKDPGKRDMYNRTGSVDGAPNLSDIFGGFGMDDALRAFQDIFGFGASSRRSAVGRDAVVDIDLELKEVVAGITREITVKRMEHCSVCGGSGADPDAGVRKCSRCGGQGRIRTVRRTILGSMQSVSACPDCSGRGEIPVKTCQSCGGLRLEERERTISVDLPAGVSAGHFIRLRGQGHFPQDEGTPGDLILRIRNVDYGEFRREEYDLVYNVALSFPEAALGKTIVVPAVEKDVMEISVPAGVQPGERLVLKRKGIKKLKGFGRGDIVVIPSVYVPKKLSRKEKKLLEDLGGSDHFKP